MDIEAIVKKHMEEQDWYNFPEDSLRAALTELSETHAIEMRAYEATVQNLERRIRDLQLELLANGEAQRVPALHAEQIRVAAVAAIREVTGCPDIKGNDGVYLVDALIVNLLAAAPKKEPRHD